MKHFVTVRDLADNQQYFINCKTVTEALNLAGKLENLELKEHKYTQIRLRATRPSLKKYHWISLVKWV